MTTTSTATPDGASVGNKRWCLALLGTIMLLFLGLVYAWSIFVPALEAEFGWVRSQTSGVFTVSISMFCLGGLATGFLTKKVAPRVAVAICALLVCAGFIFASKSNSLLGMYINYGCFVGFGVGMGYVAIISTVMRWFPDRQGLVSGLMTMGFGCGALLLGTIGAMLLNAYGWRTTFMILGVFYAGFIMVFSFFIIPPAAHTTFPAQAAKAKKVTESAGDLPTSQMLRRSSFWLFFLWVIALIFGALMCVAHATPLALALGASGATAAFMPGLISTCNGAGRVIGGYSFDILGRKKLMWLISIGFILSGILLAATLQTGSIILLTCSFILCGLGFGCVVAVNTAVISTFYGLKHYSMNLSVMNLSLIFSSLGPLVAGMLHQQIGSYAAMPIPVIGLAVLSLLLAFLLKKP